MKCKICHSEDIIVAYNGIIRNGHFGNYTKDVVPIYQCCNCGAMFHEKIDIDNDFYESDKYRESMGENIADYEAIHDKEVLKMLEYTGTNIFRNKVVVDIGCAGGSFLDFVSGAASKVIGIEPTGEFRKILENKGYCAYAYANEALKEQKNNIDVITSFDVIEHVEDPVLFMNDCYELCRDGGKIIIGTPTEQPIMRMALGEEYDKFLFSTQHLWVLNEKSLKMATELAGFKNIEVKYKQRYGLGNLISWIKNKRPSGNVNYEFISESVSKNWEINSEERGLADYIVIYAEK